MVVVVVVGRSVKKLILVKSHSSLCIFVSSIHTSYFSLQTWSISPSCLLSHYLNRPLTSLSKSLQSRLDLKRSERESTFVRELEQKKSLIPHPSFWWRKKKEEFKKFKRVKKEQVWERLLLRTVDRRTDEVSLSTHGRYQRLRHGS